MYFSHRTVTQPPKSNANCRRITEQWQRCVADNNYTMSNVDAKLLHWFCDVLTTTTNSASMTYNSAISWLSFHAVLPLSCQRLFRDGTTHSHSRLSALSQSQNLQLRGWSHWIKIEAPTSNLFSAVGDSTKVVATSMSCYHIWYHITAQEIRFFFGSNHQTLPECDRETKREGENVRDG